MPREIDLTDIVSFINRCRDNSSLQSIQAALNVQRNLLGGFVVAGSLNPHSYRIGQIVRMNHRVRPNYLRGLTVTVVGINRTTVSVRFPVGLAYGRFSGNQRVRLPISLIAGVVNAHAPASHAPANNGEDDGLAAEGQAGV